MAVYLRFPVSLVVVEALWPPISKKFHHVPR